MQFEYYVLNEDPNKKCIKPYNIFRNINVNNSTEREVKKYLKDPDNYTYTKPNLGTNSSEVVKGFEGFCKELESIIMWQEWSRCEYEIMVGSIFEQDPSRLEKIDCYYQCEPNIPCIAREVIWQYQNKCGMEGKKKK